MGLYGSDRRTQKTNPFNSGNDRKVKTGKRFKIDVFLKTLREEKELVESPYYYYLLIDHYLKGNAKKLALRTLFRIYPELPAGVLYVNKFMAK